LAAGIRQDPLKGLTARWAPEIEKKNEREGQIKKEKRKKVREGNGPITLIMQIPKV